MFLFLNFSNTYSRFLLFIFFVISHFFFSKLKKHYPICFIRVHVILKIFDTWLGETKTFLVFPSRQPVKIVNNHKCTKFFINFIKIKNKSWNFIFILDFTTVNTSVWKFYILIWNFEISLPSIPQFKNKSWNLIFSI